MSLNNVIRRLMLRPFRTRPTAPVRKARSNRVHLGVEKVEDRITPATLYVDNPADFIITTDQGALGALDTGDTVTWNAGAGSEHSPSSVAGLTFGTTAFGTIQSAVTAATAGDTVRVAGGTFSELVTVNKQLFLLGNQVGDDARDGRVGDPETVMNGAGLGGLFSISASDVVIDGFTIQGQTGGFPGAAVWMQPGTAGTEVRNNIVQNNVVGVFVSNNSAANPTVIERNLFRDNTNPGAAGGTDIYADEFTAGVGLQNVLIDSNTFTNTSTVVNSWAVGISNTNATPFTNITISNNTVTNHGRGVYFFGTDGATVSGNEITGATNYAVGVFTAFGTDNNANITVVNNKLTNSNRGVWVDGYAGTLNVNSNDLSGNATAGIQNDDPDAVVNAENNWWGSPTGPTSPNNPAGTGSPVTGTDANDVDFGPFLTDGTDAQPGTPGFQPVVGQATGEVVFGTAGNDTLVVTATGPNSGSYSLNGGPAVPFANITSFTFDGFDGNDTLRILNPVGGLFAPSGGIFYTGGGQPTDAVENLGGTADAGTYRPGPGAGDGVIFHDGVGAGPNQTITFSGLAPALDIVAEPTFTVFATDAINAITLSDGLVTGDGILRVAIDAFEPIDFQNKTTVVLQGGDAVAGGDAGDIILLNFTEVSAGLTGPVTVNAEDGADQITVQAVPAALAALGVNGEGDADTVQVTGALTLSAAGATLALTAEAIALNGGPITTGGAQTYTGATTLGADTALTSTGSGTITLAGTVDGAFALAVNTAGTTTLVGAVGATTPLASLATDAAGSTALNGGGVTTTGAQTLNDPVTLGANTTLTSTGAGAVTLGGTVNGAFSLAVNTSGTTTFGGAVGGATALTSVTTDAAGTTALNGGSVITTGAQAFNDAVTLGANTTLTSTGAGNVTLGGTANGAFSLAVNTAGTTTFGGAVGGATALTSVTTDAAGTTALNGGGVTTTGAQTFNDPVTLGANTALNSTGAGNITLAGSVNGAFSLAVNTAGATTLGGAIGNSTALTSLATNAGGTTALNGGSVSTTGLQVYSDPVTLGANTTLTSTGGGAVALGGTVDGGFSLVANTAGTTTFGGAVGATTPLTSLTTDAAGATALNGGGVTTTGAQTFNDPVTLGANTALTSTGGAAVTLAGTVNGAFDLAVNTAGTTTLGGTVGGITPLASLTTDAAGTTALNGGPVTTTGAQTFNDPVTLGANTTLTSTGGGAVTLAGTVDGAFDLAVNTAGATTFGGAVGGTTPLATLDVTTGTLTAGAVASGGVTADVSGTGSITGAVTGTGGLTKEGAGTLILSGTNTYAGTTAVSAGTLQVAGGSAIPDDSPVVLAGTASLDLAAGETIGDLSGPAGTTVTLNANTLTVNQVGNTTFAGVISGTGGLTKQGAGDLTLAGANNYTGDTVVDAGRLVLTGSVTSNVTVNAAGTLAGTGTVNGNVTGTGTFAPGLSPGQFTIVGNFTPAGTVAFEVNPPAVVAGSDYDQYVVTGAVDLSGATLTFAGAAGVVAPNQLVTLIDNDAADPTTLDGATTPAQGATVTINGNTYFLFYNGGDGNDVVLVEASTPGTVYVDDGFTQNPGQTIADADLGTAGAQPAIFGVSAFATINDALAAVSPGGEVVVNGGTYAEAVTLDGTTATLLRITGPDAAQAVTIDSLASAAGTIVQIDGASTLTVGDATSTSIDGTIQGTGSLIKQGTGTVSLTTANLGFFGAIDVTAGTLRVTADGALGDVTAGTTVEAGGTLAFDNVSYGFPFILPSFPEPVTLNGGTVAGLGSAAFFGPITLGATSTIDTPTAADSLDLVGEIDESVPGSGLVKTGAGTAVLGGAFFTSTFNTYTGTTQVTAGTLQVDADQPFSQAVVTGGRLAGLFGTVGGIAATGGTVDPGPATNGFDAPLFSDGDVTLDAPASFAALLSDFGNSDTLVVDGLVTLNGPTLVLTTDPFFDPTYGEQFILIDNDGVDPVAGTFAGLPEGAFVTIGGVQFQISYAGFTGNDVVLTAVPDVTVGDVTVTEGNAGTTLLTFTLTLSAASSLPISVDYATADDTATTADGDYAAAAGSVIFLPGQTTRTVTVNVTGDTRFEPTETLFLNLTGAVNARITDAQAVGTILNDDAQPTVSVTAPVGVPAEGNAGTTAYTFTVTLSNPSASPVTVDYTTTDGTATTADNDYQPAGGTLTFAPGETTKTVTVFVNGDTTFEPNETFTVDLSNPTNTTIGTGSATGTIVNDDAQPTVSVGDVSLAEGNAGTTAFTFTVTLSNPSAQTVTVDFTTTDGTAVGGTDYVTTSGTVTFAPGVTTQTVTVLVNGDVTFEPDETFTVNLSNPVNTTIADPVGLGTIVNDDNAPVISVNDAAVIEGNAGPATLTFTVTLSNPSSTPVTVLFSTFDGTATVADGDYLPASGTLTFAPGGPLTQTVTVLVNGDTTFEPDETLTLRLTSPVGGTLGDALGLGTILNDDGQPTVAVTAPAPVAEGNAGPTAVTFTVTLSNPSSQTVTVAYATADGTATAADGDYQPATGTLTFAPGVTSQTVTVYATGDTKFEANETFDLVLSGPTNATIGTGSATATILNDDAVPTVTIGDATVVEGNTGTTALTFTLTLSNPTDQTATVDYVTADGTATAADGDYLPVAAGVATFAPGQTTQTVTITVLGDTTFESDETMQVILVNGTNVAPGADLVGTGTIVNDDAVPVISVGDAAAAEGNAGPTAVTFTVTLSNPSGTPVTVSYATADGSATVGSADYVPVVVGLVTFAPGVTSQTVTVTVNGDTTFEPDETFAVNLSGAAGGTVGDGAGIGTILNDDTAPTVSVAGPAGPVPEGNAGATPVTFTVTLSNPSSVPVTVNFAAADGTATTSDDDYEPASGTLTFAPGETSKTVTVFATGDTTFEADETFDLVLSGPTGATLGTATATATLANDDPQPTADITSVTAAEGNAGPMTFTFTVTLTNPSATPVTIDYATADGTATVADNDYAAASGTLTFAPGETSKTVVVTVNGDAAFEGDETFTVTLSNPAGATLGAAVGTGTVLNDDPLPTVSVAGVSAQEGNGGTTPFVFTVTLSNPSGTPVTVAFATADGTATVLDNDYAAASGVVTFAPGQTSQTVTVTVNGDTTFEPNEAFTLVLSAPVGAAVGTGTATGSIVNDDAVPVIAVGDAAAAEGNAGPTTLTFTVTLSNPSSTPVTVNFATTDGTATVSGGDYAAASGTVTFAPGVTSQTVTVTVNGDTTFEPDETFAVNLSGAAGGTVGDGTGVGTVTNDDAAPVLSVDSPAVDEGDSGVRAVSFTVTLSNPSSQLVTVGYATADGTATVADGDYAAASGTLLYLPGETSKTVTVFVNGDITFEPDETFTLVLSSPMNATVGGAGTATIRNDDAVPIVTVSVAGVSADEGNSGTTPFAFTVTLSRPSSAPVVANYATADGTATTANNDYQAAAGSVTFAPGETSRTVTVLVTGDAVTEPDETFTLALTGATGANVAGGPATGTIRNDDAPPQVAIGTGPGTMSAVRLYDGTARQLGDPVPILSHAEFAGGVRVAAADVNGDAVMDIIAGAGPGTGSLVVVVDGKTGQEIRRFGAYEPTYTGGVFVAAADLDGDGRAEIITSPDEGGGARVRVFSGATGLPLADFLAIDDLSFRGGARVAVGDMNNDGTPDLLVGAGFGGGPRVAGFDGLTLRPAVAPVRLFNDFFAFSGEDATRLRNGVYVAVGDVDGDGYGDLIFGGGPGGAPRIRAVSGRVLTADGTTQAQVANFFAGDSSRRGGVRVAAHDLDQDGRAEIVAGDGDGDGATVTIYRGSTVPPDGTPELFDQFEAFTGNLGGVFVG